MYQQIFRFKKLQGGENFAVLTTPDNDIVLCFHKWGEHEHPSLMKHTTTAGNGLLLYFRTNDMEAIRKRPDEVHGSIAEDIHLNPNSLRKEFSFRDP